MHLTPEEPAAGPWQVVPVDELVRLAIDDQRSHDRPWILAVDGRSGSGKTTLANLLHRAVALSAVVHTDDIAWHHSFFEWSDLLVEGILKPLGQGDAVCYRPPGWVAQGRPGSIEVPSDLDLVVVEGVGASRIEVESWIDRSLWVQSDFAAAERRGIARDGGTQAARDFWHEWMAEELEFLRQQRPWERAMSIVNGTPTRHHDSYAEVVIAPAFRRSAGSQP